MRIWVDLTNTAHVLVLRPLVDLLERDGHEVTLASSGPEGLESLKKSRPDLIVLDISMPGMDGIETLGKVLAQDRSLPVILNTAYSNYKNNQNSFHRQTRQPMESLLSQSRAMCPFLKKTSPHKWEWIQKMPKDLRERYHKDFTNRYIELRKIEEKDTEAYGIEVSRIGAVTLDLSA